MTLEPRQSIDVPQLVREAYERCKDHLSPTPLEHSLYLSKELEAEVWLKLDLMQRTTSFKFRGALNKILSLSQEELDQGIVALRRLVETLERLARLHLFPRRHGRVLIMLK